MAFTVYTRNLIPSCALPKQILLEAWTKRHVDVFHLHVFGSTVYVKIPIDKNGGQQINGGSKLDDRTMVGKLIGYLPGHGGYQVLLGDGRVVRSKDVDFDEGNPHLTTSGDGNGDVNDVGDQQNANLPKPTSTPMEKPREPMVTPVETMTGNVDVNYK